MVCYRSNLVFVIACLRILFSNGQDTESPTLTPAPNTLDTSAPTALDTEAPIETEAPTALDTEAPIETEAPTALDTEAPIETEAPTPGDTESQTEAPNSLTTAAPTVTVVATSDPTAVPATEAPTVFQTFEPSQVTISPTGEPISTPSPTTAPLGAWQGCVDPGASDGGLVKIGDPTTVCFVLGPGGNWNSEGVTYARWLFQPKADQYSRFHIPNSFKDFVQLAAQSPIREGNLTVHASSQQFLSFLRIYLDPENSRVYPFLTAIIDVKDGVVQGVAWDNACVFCTSDLCLENTYNFAGVNSQDLDPPLNENTRGCHLSMTHCAQIQSGLDSGKQQENKKGGYAAEGSNICDLTFYVVWTGTDKDGQAFQSSSSRFGAFPESNIQDRINNNIPDFPDLPF